MAGSHVPKFGNWDNDNVHYTTYFENARKERAGVIMNPNDPEENPEAFMYMRGNQESSGDHNNCFQIPNKHVSAGRQHAESRRRPNSPKRSTLDPQKSSFSVSASGSSSDQRSGSSPSNDNKHQRAPSIPKFGAWDETDPESGDGFTAIFNKVKEEKKSPPSQYPILPPQPSKVLDGHSKHRSSSPKSKVCCCIFSRMNN